MSAEDLINGALLGSGYAALALGLSLAFGTLGVMNLAHGEFLVGGGYLALVLQEHAGLDPALSLPVVAAACFVVGYAVQRGLLGRIMRQSLASVIVATFALSLVLQSVFAQAFTNDVRALTAPYATSGATIAGVRVQMVDLLALGVAMAGALASYLVLTRTRAGVAVRASAADPEAAGAMGIDVARVYAVTFGAAAALAGVAGVVVVGLGDTLTPSAGLAWLVVSFAVVVLAGLGSTWGVVVAGVGLGLVQAIGSQAAGSAYRDVVLYGTLFVLLSAYPAGLARRRLA